MEDRSLDDFLGTDADGEETSEPVEASEDNAETERNTEGDQTSQEASTASSQSDKERSQEDTVSIEPTTPTAVFDPGGVCPQCGDATTRLWTREDGRYCRSCIEW